MAALKLCKPWTPLGEMFTLVQGGSHEVRRGCTEGYIQMSGGLEHVGDVIADLDHALRLTL